MGQGLLLQGLGLFDWAEYSRVASALTPWLETTVYTEESEQKKILHLLLRSRL